LSLSPEVRIDLMPVAEGVSFAVAYGSESVKTENAKLDQAALVAKLKAQLQNSPEALRIHVAAHKDAPYEAIRDLVNELADLKTFGRGISNVYAEVSEKRP
jgi:biopolymer transport protein ExbD